MSIRKRRNDRARAAGLSANGLTIRVGDQVTWQDRILHDLHTGTVAAVTTTQAKVIDDGKVMFKEETLPISSLTVDRRARDDDKTAALVGLHQTLSAMADAGDLTAFTFLTNDWPELVPADLRRLLDLGPDVQASSESLA